MQSAHKFEENIPEVAKCRRPINLNPTAHLTSTSDWQELGRNTLGNDVMLQMGGDFGFENANAWFKNLEILMAAVNKEGRVNVSDYAVLAYIRGIGLLSFSVQGTDGWVDAERSSLGVGVFAVVVLLSLFSKSLVPYACAGSSPKSQPYVKGWITQLSEKGMGVYHCYAEGSHDVLAPLSSF